jgi:AhpD family alkylhydroperoxidase
MAPSIRQIHPVPPGQAEGLVAAVYDQARREFGLVPDPLLLHSPDPPLLLAAWAMLRESVLVGALPRRLKETVAAAVSRANRCPFCVDAHTVMLGAAGDPAGARVLAARPERRRQILPDPHAEALAAWAESTAHPESRQLRRPPFAPGNAEEILATACCFHYINRLATVFLADSILPRPARWLRRPLLALAGRLLGGKIASDLEPGRAVSLSSLPMGSRHEVPGISWTSPDGAIREAMEHWYGACEEAGGRVLSAEARRRLAGRVADWRGGALPLAGGWIDRTLGGLADTERPAARLALLTALAPHRVTADDLSAAHGALGGDRDLLAAAVWGAAQATCRIGAWLDPGRASAARGQSSSAARPAAVGPARAR